LRESWAGRPPRNRHSGVVPLSEHDDLTPTISRRPLPDDVQQRRREQAERAQQEQALYEPRIAAHITAHRLALDALEWFHQERADVLDFDLVADTGPAASWQMAGRCIGIARLMLDALDLGYCGEVVILARSLHEATRLLDAFGYDDHNTVLRTWLADDGRDWVRPKAARIAIDAYEQRLEDAMTAAGERPLKRTAELSRRIYDQQSQAAHNRRSFVQNGVSPELRVMARGPELDWLRRATTVDSMCRVVEEAVMSVGEAIERFYGEGFYSTHVKPLIAGFEAIRAAQPLP